MLLKPFLLACWLTSVCATQPHDYTLTLSTYWQAYCLSLGMFQQTIRVFIHPHAVLLPPLYFPWMQFPNRPVSKGAINCNCDICDCGKKLHYLSLSPFDYADFPEWGTFSGHLRAVNTNSQEMLFFPFLTDIDMWKHSVNELSSQVLCEMFSCNVWACSIRTQEFERSNHFIVCPPHFSVFSCDESLNAHLCPWLLLLFARQSEINGSAFFKLHSPM